MKKKKKELIIIIPLIVLAGIISFTLTLPFIVESPEAYIDNQCQEGWFKYESEKGILCAKTEMTQKQVDDFFG